MPSKLKVKIDSVSDATRGNFNGFEILGYNETDNDKYKQFVFETTQKGDVTKVAAAVQKLTSGDWVEFTVDDTKYRNITFVNPGVAAGDSSGAAAASPARTSGGGGGKSAGPAESKMSKAEWAAKDAAKELSIHRQSALKQAVISCAADAGKLTKAKVEQIEKMAKRFLSFLAVGDFDGKLLTVEPVSVPTEEAGPVATEAPPVDPSDDDIPF